MPKYSTSEGVMIDKKKIDRRVAQAKKDYIENFFFDHGYHFCERTSRSDLPLDCSHIISVRMCQASGRSELAWDENNIELLNRDAHMEIERWPNDKREAWYFARIEGKKYSEFIDNYKI